MSGKVGPKPFGHGWTAAHTERARALIGTRRADGKKWTQAAVAAELGFSKSTLLYHLGVKASHATVAGSDEEDYRANHSGDKLLDALRREHSTRIF